MASLEAHEWDTARKRWEVDGLSNAALAKEIGVSKSAVTGYAKRNGWARKTNVSNNVSDVSDHVTDDVKTQIESSVERVSDNVSDTEIKTETKAGRGGAREGSGRPNSAQTILAQTIKEKAAQYGDDAIAVMVDLMNDPEVPANVKLAAAEKLLDRGYGKPTQAVEVTGEVSYIDKAKLEEFYANTIVEMRKNELAIEGRFEKIKTGGY